jgi:diguanylate cyclase (GGDEF)-like protein
VVRAGRPGFLKRRGNGPIWGAMLTWRPRVSVAHLCLGLLYVAMMALAFGAMRGGGHHYKAVGELARVVFGLIGLVASVRAARLPELPVRARRAWQAVAVSFAVLVLSPVMVWLLERFGLAAADDVLHVGFLLVLLIALQLFPLAATNRRGRWKTALDASVVLVGGAMVLWYGAFGPYVERNGFSVTAMVAAGLYPLFDLALLYSVASVLLRGADGSAQRPLRPLAAGTLILFAGDALHGYLHGHGQLEMHSPWQFVCWITADALLAAAAIEQVRRADRQPRERQREMGGARFLPYGAVAVAHVLMLAAAVQEGDFYPWGGLAVGGAVLSTLVLTRQALVQRESDERAVTDTLTGLPNRHRFRASSHRSLARGARSGRYSAILVIDMNGFKEVNDTLGHKSGDLVLVAFAELLRRCVPAGGLPARLGGDEFAVVLPDLSGPEQAYDVAGRIAGEVHPVVIDGKLIMMAASIGVAVSAPGELTHDEIVHRADTAMYQAKKLAPQTRWTPWRESFEHPDRMAAAA